jgi:chromate reductase
MKTKKIGVIVGSLRKASWNRKIAKVLMSFAPPSFEMEIIEIGQLPHYNQDDDENPSQISVEFKAKISALDGVLFVTPEYNRSFPGVLKNALDVASRPYGQSAWDAKPGAVVSVSPGAIGGFGANHHIRQALTFLNIPCMQQPEAYIGGVANMFDEDGNFNNKSTEDFLRKFMAAFVVWVETNTKKS